MSFLRKFFTLPVVKAQEEELVDPQADLRVCHFFSFLLILI